MTIPDVNILLHAYDAGSARHELASHWLQETLSGTRPVGLPWLVLLGFIRISTRPRIWQRPLAVGDAVACARSWIAAPCAELIGPGPRHADIFFGLLKAAGTAGNLTSDAHLAAMAIEHRGIVATTDSDFARFPGVKWFNPAKA